MFSTSLFPHCHRVSEPSGKILSKRAKATSVETPCWMALPSVESFFSTDSSSSVFCGICKCLGFLTNLNSLNLQPIISLGTVA